MAGLGGYRQKIWELMGKPEAAEVWTQRQEDDHYEESMNSAAVRNLELKWWLEGGDLKKKAQNRGKEAYFQVRMCVTGTPERNAELSVRTEELYDKLKGRKPEEATWDEWRAAVGHEQEEFVRTWSAHTHDKMLRTPVGEEANKELTKWVNQAIDKRTNNMVNVWRYFHRLAE